MLVDAWNGQWEECFLIKNTFSQKHLRCLGSRLGSRLPQGERYGLDGDGKEGKKEGRKEGKEEGEEKEGREEGREEGEEKEEREEEREGGRKGGRKGRCK